MTGWLMGRIAQAAGAVLAMTAIVFLGVNVIGNPVDSLISADADQIERARIVAQLGLDQPIWRQFGHFLSSLVRGEFAPSYVYNQPALHVMLERLPATLELAVSALIIATTVGIPLGLYAGLRPQSPLSRSIMTGSILGFSLPNFWLALLLIMVFAVQLRWLPGGGRGETRELLGVPWSFLTLDGLQHLLLPAVTLAMAKTALVIRLVRAGVREVLPQDFIRFARAKGVRPRRVVGVHLLKNIMVPVVTIVGIEFASLIAFSVVTENIFAWPGMGKLIIESINVLDRPVIVVYLMLIVVLFVVINLVVDIIYAMLDPRVSITSGKDG